MAIKKSITVSGMGVISNNVITIETGYATITTSPLYIKVENIRGSKTNITFTVAFKDEAKDKILMRKDYDFVVSLGEKNFIAQAYEHLKTLSEFEDAEDC